MKDSLIGHSLWLENVASWMYLYSYIFIYYFLTYYNTVQKYFEVGICERFLFFLKEASLLT